MCRLALFLLIGLTNINAQDHKIPDFPLPLTHQDSIYYSTDVLGLKDKDALIFKITYQGGLVFDFIAFQTDAKIYIGHFEANFEEKKFKLRKRRIRGKRRKRYWKYLNTLLTTKRLNFNRSLLNKRKRINKDGSVSVSVISDCTSLGLYIIKGKSSLVYGSNCPWAYIDGKGIGFREKEKFINLCNELSTLIYKTY